MASRRSPSRRFSALFNFLKMIASFSEVTDLLYSDYGWDIVLWLRG
jgi:hypothetical protein